MEDQVTENFDYFLGLDLFDKKPYCDLLKGYNELFPNTKPCLKLNDSAYIYNKAIKILFTRSIVARNRINGNDEEIKTHPLISVYEEGFRDGEKYFDETYKVTTDIVYGNQFKLFERTLHDMYFHSAVNGAEGGWRKYIVCIPFIISNSEIYKYGYYAGIVHKLETLKAKYSIIFRGFDKCIEPQNNSEIQPPEQSEVIIEKKQSIENDFTQSTIEDWLFEFKKMMNETDYNCLVSALIHYFDKGIFPILTKVIQINGRPNKKLFGWALNRIFESKGKGVEKDLLLFAKQNISLFSNVQFDEKNIQKSNLYKYFTTQTK